MARTATPLSPTPDMVRQRRGKRPVLITGPWRVLLCAFLTLSGCATGASPGNGSSKLNKIRPAPAFELETQRGESLSLSDLHGKVAVVTFVYTTCPAGCSPLTAKLAQLSNRLDATAQSQVYFAFITLDPEHDTREVLQHQAETYRLDPKRTAFLFGTEAEIRTVAAPFGVVFRKTPDGLIDHTFLTSVVDREGMIRVQYMGVQFDPDDLLADVLSLVREGA